MITPPENERPGKVFCATAQAGRYVLRLYVSGLTERSRRCILNIRSICNENLGGEYDLEVIDIYQKLALAKKDQILTTPTLIKLLPLPQQRIVGDLSNRERVLFGLDIKKRLISDGSAVRTGPQT